MSLLLQHTHNKCNLHTCSQHWGRPTPNAQFISVMNAMWHNVTLQLQSLFYSSLPLRAESVQEWETLWAKLPWTSLTNSPPHRPAVRSNNCWEVSTNTPLMRSRCWVPENHCCALVSHLTQLNPTVHSHYKLSYCRCFSCDAGARVEGLLQQLRPHKPQHQSWRHNNGNKSSYHVLLQVSQSVLELLHHNHLCVCQPSETKCLKNRVI